MPCVTEREKKIPGDDYVCERDNLQFFYIFWRKKKCQYYNTLYSAQIVNRIIYYNKYHTFHECYLCTDITYIMQKCVQCTPYIHFFVLVVFSNNYLIRHDTTHTQHMSFRTMGFVCSL